MRYLLFALRAPKARQHIEHFATGTSDSMRNIAQGVITSVPVDLPPLREQRHIAARLNAQLAEVEAARHAAHTQCTEVGELIAAIYREAYAQIAPIAVPPTFADPPPGWKWRKLTDIARLESGHTPSRSRPDWCPASRRSSASSAAS